MLLTPQGQGLVRVTTAHAQQHGFHIEACDGAALLDGPLHLGDHMVFEELQDAGVLLEAAAGAVLPLQGGAQLLEQWRQLPAAEDVGMVQRRGPALQRAQVVLRVKDLLLPVVTARVRGHDLAPQHHVDPLDIQLDGHGLEGGGAGHAIAVVVAADHLVLVHLGRLHDARVEGTVRE